MLSCAVAVRRPIDESISRLASILVVIILATIPLFGCSSERAESDAFHSSQGIRDDEGRPVSTAKPRQRVISLVPSVTETILALGAGNHLVARTRFDTATPVQHLPSVGGLLDPNLETILSLHPDLVVTWPGNDAGAVSEQLVSMGIPVYAARVETLADFRRHTVHLGDLLGVAQRADSLTTAIADELRLLEAELKDAPRPTVLYVVWTDPPMTTGPGTFIDSLIAYAGGTNVFGDAATSWPHVGLEEIVFRQPQYVVFTDEVGDRESRTAWLATAPGWRDLKAARDGRYTVVEADLFNRPGPRVTAAARQLAALLHPDRLAERP